METTPRASAKIKDRRQLALALFMLLYVIVFFVAIFRYDNSVGLWVMLVGTGIEAVASLYIWLTPRNSST